MMELRHQDGLKEAGGHQGVNLRMRPERGWRFGHCRHGRRQSDQLLQPSAKVGPEGNKFGGGDAETHKRKRVVVRQTESRVEPHPETMEPPEP
jgi:hypothetical protein